MVRLGYFFTAQNGTLSVSTFVPSFLGLVEFEKLQKKDIKMFTDIFIKEMTFLVKIFTIGFIITSGFSESGLMNACSLTKQEFD